MLFSAILATHIHTQYSLFRVPVAATPVFIGGFRSGTTLLINLLGLHPQISPWFETKEMCEALRWLKVLQDPAAASQEAVLVSPPAPAGFTASAVYQRMLQHMQQTEARLEGRKGSGKGSHEKYPLGDDYVGYSLAAAEKALQEWLQAVETNSSYASVKAATARLLLTLAQLNCTASGKQLWINKTPEITRFAALLRDMLGHCRVIYLVRNGLDVVASAKKLGWGNCSFLAWGWKELLLQTRAAMQQHPDMYLELRYEQLVADPVTVLNQVLEFSGLNATGAELVQQFIEQMGSAAFARSAKHAQVLDAAELAQFSELAGELQRQLGYPL